MKFAATPLVLTPFVPFRGALGVFGERRRFLLLVPLILISILMILTKLLMLVNLLLLLLLLIMVMMVMLIVLIISHTYDRRFFELEDDRGELSYYKTQAILWYTRYGIIYDIIIVI